MKFTGERFIPEYFERVDDEIVYEHINRYKAVSSCLKNEIVLDAACGSGYGSNILSESLSSVYGVDISEEAINYAKQKYGYKDNLQFLQSSVEKLPFNDNFFDKAVSFETIEHVDEKIQKKFLKEIVRVLKDDGIFIISTPDRLNYSEKNNYNNEFHVKEFYAEEFFNFLRSFFSNVVFYYQKDEVANFIYNVDSKSLELNQSIGLNVEAKYLVAVCSNFELEDDIIKSTAIINNNMLMDLQKRIFDLQNEVDEKNKWAFSLQRHIEEKDRLIKEKDRLIEEKDLLIQLMKLINRVKRVIKYLLPDSIVKIIKKLIKR